MCIFIQQQIHQLYNNSKTHTQNMLQTEQVFLPESHTLNCTNCSQILLEITFIDQFLKPLPSEPDQQQQHRNSYKYYVLSTEVSMQGLNVCKKPFLYIAPDSKYMMEGQKRYHRKILPYDMMYLREVFCGKCKHLLGYKFETITKDMVGCYDLIGRIIISIGGVRVWAQNQDITNILLQQFQLQPSQKLPPNQQDFLSEPFSQKQPHIRKSCLKKQHMNMNMNMKQLRSNLQEQMQNKEEKQMIEEILSTVDFFTEVLDTLDKRIRHTENACLLLKKRVEKLVPMLRKQ